MTRILPLTTLLLTALAAGASSPAYNFLNIPSSTTTYGLGGINISSVEDDINTAEQNPALLGPEMGKQLSFNYMRYVGESNFAGVVYGMPAGEHGAWAARVQYFGYGEIQGADIDGNFTQTFSPKDVAVSAAYSHDITDRWRGGAALKFINSTYDSYSAIALATDLGVNYYDPDADQSFSLVIANLGGQVKKFANSYDRLPIDVRLGWTGALGDLPLRASVTAWNLTKWKLPYWDNGDGSDGSKPELKDSFGSNLFRHLVFGVDMVPSQNFHIGIGYNYKTRTDMSTYKRSFLSGFSACLGLKVRNYGVGIALAAPHTGVTTFMVNITAAFGALM